MPESVMHTLPWSLTRVWYKNFSYHREDGPAVEYEDGTNSWYINGLRHREDGPAVERPNGIVEYWLKGTEYDVLNWMLKAYEITQAENKDET